MIFYEADYEGIINFRSFLIIQSGTFDVLSSYQKKRKVEITWKLLNLLFANVDYVCVTHLVYGT